jgi:sarcosine oxidase, subunit beta
MSRAASVDAPIAFAETAPASADLVVVGGGVVGAATAFFAVRAGLRVVVVERRPELASLTTPAATGAFRLQFDNAEEIALVREGVDLFASFDRVTGLEGWDLGLRHGGYLFCALTEAAAARARRLVARQRTWGLRDVELLDGDEARRRFPYLAPRVIQARFRAGDGWLDPRRLALGYAAAASAGRMPGATGSGGATFLVATPVTGFLRGAAGSVTGVATSRGPVAAGAVVIATGPFLAETAALAGVDVEIRPTRRQKLIVEDAPEVPRDAPMTIEEETAAHWRPAGRAGAFALWTEAGTPPSPPSDPVPADDAWADGLLDPRSDHALSRVSPFWEEVARRGRAAWTVTAGQYEVTPDHRPYLGPTRVPGLHLNGGYSGHGIMASAAGSRIVVDLLTGRADPAANAFRVDRSFAPRERDIL